MMALQIIPGTAKQFLSLVFSCSRSPRWTPFFALIVEIICVRKSRKTRYFPFPPVLLSLPSPFPSSFSLPNANTRP